MADDMDELRARVAQACRVLGVLGVTHGSLGHVSLRIRDGDRMLIKGKGPFEASLRSTTASDVVEVDFSAKKVEGRDDLRPPSESYIHIWLYKTNPELASVIHVHPEYAVLLTMCGIEIVPSYGCFGPGGKLALEGIPTFPDSTLIDDDERGERLARFMASRRVALMMGHGATIAGATLEESATRAVALHELTRMTYRAHAIGTPRRLPEQDIERLGRPLDPARPRGSAGGEAGLRSRWRLYCELAGEEPVG